MIGTYLGIVISIIYFPWQNKLKTNDIIYFMLANLIGLFFSFFPYWLSRRKLSVALHFGTYIFIFQAAFSVELIMFTKYGFGTVSIELLFLPLFFTMNYCNICYCKRIQLIIQALLMIYTLARFLELSLEYEQYIKQCLLAMLINGFFYYLSRD